MTGQRQGQRPVAVVLAIALLAFVVLGLPDGGLGVAWPTLRNEFDRSLADLGVLIASGSVGYLAVSLLYGQLHDRLGTGSLLAGGSLLLVGGLIGIALAPTWIVLVAAAATVGAGGGLVDTGMNAHAALAFDIRSINLLHACYGVGATLGPIVLTVSLTTTGAWRAGYLAMAVVQVGVLIAVLARRAIWLSPAVEHEAVTTPRRLRGWLLLALFFLYAGIEVGTGQWSFTLLTEDRGYDTTSAGIWVAVYWGGLTAGRLGLGFFGDRFSSLATLHASMAIALFGLGLFWLDPAGFGVVGLPVTSLGLAAIFPTLVSVTPARLGADRSTRSMGYQLAAANLGVATIPWLLGIAAQELGLSALAPGLFLLGSALGILHLVSARETRAI